MKLHLLLAGAAAAALLAGCGGGGGRDDEPPAASDAVPDSANKSAAGMVRWMQALAAEDAEAKEPVDAARFAPKAPDDAEPIALR